MQGGIYAWCTCRFLLVSETPRTSCTSSHAPCVYSQAYLVPAYKQTWEQIQPASDLGQDCGTYKWCQSQTEVCVFVQLPEQIRRPEVCPAASASAPASLAQLHLLEDPSLSSLIGPTTSHDLYNTSNGKIVKVVTIHQSVCLCV